MNCYWDDIKCKQTRFDFLKCLNFSQIGLVSGSYLCDELFAGWDTRVVGGWSANLHLVFRVCIIMYNYISRE